jgi:hypothetical protein
MSVIDFAPVIRVAAYHYGMLPLLCCLVAAVILALLLGWQVFIRPIHDWTLWPAIQRAKREIRKAARRRVANSEVLSRQGATRINPGHLGFCIKTNTDQERDLLRQDPQIFKEFRDALIKAGYPTDTYPVVRLGIQSQETVDREYGGSWYEAEEFP